MLGKILAHLATSTFQTFLSRQHLSSSLGYNTALLNWQSPSKCKEPPVRVKNETQNIPLQLSIRI